MHETLTTVLLGEDQLAKAMAQAVLHKRHASKLDLNLNVIIL